MTNLNTGKSSDQELIEQDGVSHINIHAKLGKTELGQRLAHWDFSPFEHPFFGRFNSMEGFWYYMRSRQNLRSAGDREDQLRHLSGHSAKALGMTTAVIRYDDFKEDIMAANYQKILQSKADRKHDSKLDLLTLFTESKLPFKQYYVHAQSGMVIPTQDADWLCEGFENIRSALQFDQIPQCWVNASGRYQQSITDNKPLGNL